MKTGMLSCAFFIAAALLAGGAGGAEEVPPDHSRQIQAAAPEQATVAPSKPRRVLIWITPAHLMDKDPHKGYCIPYGTRAFETLGRKTGAFEPVVSDDLAMLLPENIREFDAIILNNASGPWITPTDADMRREAFGAHGPDKAAAEVVLRRSFLEYVKSGGGIVALHFAIGANGHWPEFREMLGAGYWGHPWNEEVGIRVEEPDHPLSAAFGGKDFRIADEIYQFRDPYSRRNLRVLLSLDTSSTNMNVRWIHRTDGDFALAWVRMYGRGRVFYTALGHRAEIYRHPALLRFFLDSIQFATGDLDAPTEPRVEAPAVDRPAQENPAR